MAPITPRTTILTAYDGESFTYQGDVVRLVDSGKNTVASYQYDPYGKVISATGTLAEINPLRYGHTKQLQQLGIVKFAIGIGIPSAFEIGGGSYYDRPWEITADIYGGVQSRQHAEKDIKAGFLYLACSKYLGPFWWLLMEEG